MSSDEAIRTDGLTRIYRQPWRRRAIRAVDGVSLSVQRGAIFGLLGPNGAGKTTFVKMLLSIVRPTAGTAHLLGCDCRKPESRRPIGYLPENQRFLPYLTGAGFLEFSGALSGMQAAERRRRSAELLELVGLRDWADVRLSRYSKGMLQRIGLAQTLMHSPELLILDEPTDGVDPSGRRQIRDVLSELRRRGVTIFLNSHLLGEVELLCEEVAIMDRGRVVLRGKVRDLTAGRAYRLIAADVPHRLFDELSAGAAAAGLRDGLAEFQFPGRDELNLAVDRLRAEGCPLESIVATRSTLEEVFLRTVEPPAPEGEVSAT